MAESTYTPHSGKTTKSSCSRILHVPAPARAFRDREAHEPITDISDGDVLYGFCLGDLVALQKIKGILDKGNNAEVKQGRTGITVLEVRKTIVD